MKCLRYFFLLLVCTELYSGNSLSKRFQPKLHVPHGYLSIKKDDENSFLLPVHAARCSQLLLLDTYEEQKNYEIQLSSDSYDSLEALHRSGYFTALSLEENPSFIKQKIQEIIMRDCEDWDERIAVIEGAMALEIPLLIESGIELLADVCIEASACFFSTWFSDLMQAIIKKPAVDTALRKEIIKIVGEPLLPVVCTQSATVGRVASLRRAGGQMQFAVEPVGGLLQDMELEQIANATRTTTVYTLPQATYKAELNHSAEVELLDCTIDGKRGLCKTWFDAIELWDIPSNHAICILKSGVRSFKVGQFSPHDSYALIADDKIIYVWNVATGELLCDLECHNTLCSVVFSPNEECIAVGFKNGTVIVCNVIQNFQMMGCELRAEVQALAFNDSGTQFAVAVGSQVYVFTIRDGSLYSHCNHNEIITCLSFSADEKYLYTGSVINTVKKWELATRQLLCVLPHQGTIKGICDVCNDKKVAVASFDQIRLWSFDELNIVWSATQSSIEKILFVVYLNTLFKGVPGALSLRTIAQASGLMPLEREEIEMKLLPLLNSFAGKSLSRAIQIVLSKNH